VDTSRIEGVDKDLRVRPFFAHGGTLSIREFIVGALHAEMGMHAYDPDLAAASAGGKVTTPAGRQRPRGTPLPCWIKRTRQRFLIFSTR